MSFDIAKYTDLAGKLQYDDIDFDDFRDQPLDENSLRTLRYMHDVEYHTVCYLRDLLVTRAHNDTAITTFLTFWVFEEYWHGEVIAEILKRHDEVAGAPRIEESRAQLGMKDRLRPIGAVLGSAVFKDLPALHMAWGAVNEYSTQSGYAQLIQRAQHPTLTTVLKRIMKQEGRHIDFYSSQAAERLAASKKAQKVTRWALGHVWGPVGSSVMPKDEVRFLIGHLFDDAKSWSAAERIDRQIDRLPGLEGLQLITGSIRKFGGYQPDAAGAAG